MKRDMWLGAVIGAVLGAVAWQAFLALEPVAEDAGEAIINLWTGILAMGTLAGDAVWMGYALGAVVGALIGFVGMKVSAGKRQAQQLAASKAAAVPHPMD